MAIPRKLILANWKLNQTESEIHQWVKDFFGAANLKVFLGSLEVAVAPPFPYLATLAAFLSRGLVLAAQDVSRFRHGGAYTGEVSATQLKDLAVKYVLIGHSERRNHLGETNRDVAEKILRCRELSLIPVVAVSNLAQVQAITASWAKLLTQTAVVAYEPIEAIGTGRPESPAQAEKMALAIKEMLGNNTQVLYGGSVNQNNVAEYVSLPSLDGVLVGGASLQGKRFAELVRRVGRLDKIKTKSDQGPS